MTAYTDVEIPDEIEVPSATGRVSTYGFFFYTVARRGVRDLVGARRNRTRIQRLYGLSSDGFILHCPVPQRLPSNPFRRYWIQACANYFADETIRQRYSDSDDLTIVTYNTEQEAGLLERCLQHLGLERYVVLGKGVENWGWIHKIGLVLDYLESGRCTTEYVLCLDGDDVLIVADPALALERFLESACKVLFCSTRGNQPPSSECWEFENSVGEYRDPRHRHLNAGGYIGEAKFVQRRLREIMDAYLAREAWCFTRFGFDDQLAWRQLHRRYYPELKVDASRRVFVRFDEHR